MRLCTERSFVPLLWAAVGAGLLSDGYFLLARGGWLVRSPLALVFPLATAAVLAGLIASAVCAPVRRNVAIGGLGLLALTYVAALAVLALVPPIAHDELSYHLAMPRLFFRVGRVFESPAFGYTYYPMLAEVQYLPLLAHVGESAPKILHLLFGLGTAAVVYRDLAERVRGELAALAGVLLLTTPTVAILATRAYVDLALLFYGAIAFVGLLRWARTDRLAPLVLSALAAGCATAVKWNGLQVIGLLALGTSLLAAPRGSARALRLAMLYAIVASLPALPWLARNWILTGNPVFPFFPEVFGGLAVPEMARLDPISHRRLLYGESWPDIVLLPLRVFLTGREASPSLFDGVLNPLYLLGFLWALRAGAGRQDRTLALVAAVYVPTIFFSHDFVSRYLVVVLVPLGVLATQALQSWLDRTAAGTRWIAAAAVAALAFNVVHLAWFWGSMRPLDYLTGRESRTEFITRFVPEYPVALWANANLRGDGATYLAFLADRSYYWDRPVTYEQRYYSSGIRIRDAVRAARDGCGVVAALRGAGIGTIAASDRLLASYLDNNLHGDERRRWNDFRNGHLRVLTRHRGYGLYEITAAGCPPAEAAAERGVEPGRPLAGPGPS